MSPSDGNEEVGRNAASRSAEEEIVQTDDEQPRSKQEQGEKGDGELTPTSLT